MDTPLVDLCPIRGKKVACDSPTLGVVLVTAESSRFGIDAAMTLPYRCPVNPTAFLRILAFLVGWAVGLLPDVLAQPASLSSERLQSLLQRFPDADANRDGTLTEEEALAYAARTRGIPSANSSAANLAPAPTVADASYGPHGRNVLDFWRAKSDGPAPVVVYIHGGGFVGGDKSAARRDRLIQECLDAGVSFAAINYRYLAADAPLPAILRDCARAVQFIRAKSAEWNVDRTRIAAYGGSAGAGSSLWLAFHDDLADPTNSDPVLRESTRLVCVGAMQSQFSYDFSKWSAVFGEDAVQRFGGRYRLPDNYGFATQEESMGEAGRKVRADCDIIALITKDDPPVFISSTLPDLALETTNQFLHHPKHSQLLYERCREIGLPVVAVIPAVKVAPSTGDPASWRAFVFAQLKVKPIPTSGLGLRDGEAKARTGERLGDGAAQPSKTR